MAMSTHNFSHQHNQAICTFGANINFPQGCEHQFPLTCIWLDFGLNEISIESSRTPESEFGRESYGHLKLEVINQNTGLQTFAAPVKFSSSCEISQLLRNFSPCEILCKTRENFNFLKKGKMVISAKNRNFTFFEATRVTCDMR